MTLSRGLGKAIFSILCTTFTLNIAQSTPQKAQQPVTRILYGDVTVERMTSSEVKLNPAGYKIMGKNSLATIPYKRSNALLKVHADVISTRKIGIDDFAETVLTGNITFTLSQKQKDGSSRSLTGTANQGSLNRTTQKIVLLGNVKAQITDTENLAEPAALNANRIEVDMTSTPYRYTLFGEGGSHEFRLRPKEKANTKSGRKTTGEIVVHDYDRVEYQSKSDMLFLGTRTVFEYKDTESYVKAHSSHIEAKFDDESSELQRVEAKGGVQIRTERTRKSEGDKQNATEIMEGYATSIVQDVPKQTLTLEGGIHITVTSPDLLAVPAEIVAERLILDIVGKDKRRYQLYANPKTAKLTLQPKPKAEAEKPTTSPENALVSSFQLGAISFTQFTYGAWEVGQEIDVRGNRMLFESTDAKSSAGMRFLALHLMTKFSADSSIKSVMAEGNVEYSVQQKPKPTKELKERALQVVRGNTPRILFTNSNRGENQTAEVQGPFRMEIIAPEKLLEPGVVEGKTGDSIRLRLLNDSYEFDILSPKETATIRILPIELVDTDEKAGKEKKK